MKEKFLKLWDGKTSADDMHAKLKGTKGFEDLTRKLCREWIKEKGGASYQQRCVKYIQDINNDTLFLKNLEKGLTVAEMCDLYGKNINDVLDVIDRLKSQGYNIKYADRKYFFEKNIVPQENKHIQKWKGDNIIKFGVVSDTHLCSKYQQLTFLNYLYDVFKGEGIKTVYHSGDISEGDYKGRAGHVYERFKHGVDEQADYIIENYPKREGMETHFITGNHDHTHVMNGGADIGKMISRCREDMKYLGQGNAKINITPNCILELNHPLDGSAYALSYALQKLIDSMSGGEKPNILMNGHHHKFMSMFYRNIHAFEVPCCEAQTPFMKGKKLAAHVGGLMIEARVDDEGTIQGLTNTLIPQYYAVKNDY